MEHMFPQFDYIFLFDQSSGLTKMREDGLNVSNMNVTCGGSTLKMHDTVITEVGPHVRLFDVGETQRMYFTNDDDGPFWMNDEEKANRKFDKILQGSKVKEKTKAQLLVDLRSKGVDTTQKRFLKEELVELCRSNNIETSSIVGNIEPGWVEKPKGCFKFCGSVDGLMWL